MAQVPVPVRIGQRGALVQLVATLRDEEIDQHLAEQVLPEAALYAAQITQGAASALALDEEGF